MLGRCGYSAGYGGGLGPAVSARVGPLGGSAIINSLNSTENLSVSTPMDSMSSRWELERERERAREREREREVFGGRENENPNTETSKGFYLFIYFIFMARDWLNLGILFLG